MLVQINEIGRDPTLQMRAKIDPELVEQYAADFDLLPPVVVFRLPDGTLTLAEGFHRCAAALKRGLSALEAVVKEGTYSAAWDWAARANLNHGRPLTHWETTRVIVEARARHPEMTQDELGDLLNISQSRVSRVLTIEEVKQDVAAVIAAATPPPPPPPAPTVSTPPSSGAASPSTTSSPPAAGLPTDPSPDGSGTHSSPPLSLMPTVLSPSSGAPVACATASPAPPPVTPPPGPPAATPVPPAAGPKQGQPKKALKDEHLFQLKAAPKELRARLAATAITRKWTPQEVKAAIAELANPTLTEARREELLGGEADPVVILPSGEVGVLPETLAHALAGPGPSDAYLCFAKWAGDGLKLIASVPPKDIVAAPILQADDLHRMAYDTHYLTALIAYLTAVQDKARQALKPTLTLTD